MNTEDLLNLCYLVTYPRPVTQETAKMYEEALALGYVIIDKPKRARSDKFFITDSGRDVVQPVMYRHIYNTFYMHRDADFTETILEEYHSRYPELDGFDLMIKYHVDRIQEYDGNVTKRPPYAFFLHIANLYRHKGNYREAMRYFLVCILLTASGTLEIPTREQLAITGSTLEDAIRSIDINRLEIPKGLIAEVSNCIKQEGLTVTSLQDMCNDVYESLQLPTYLRDRDSILQEIITKINQE